MPLRLCVASGSRADWGLLREPARLISRDPYFTLQLVATGSHLSPRFGETVVDLRRDGFVVDAEIPILEDQDDIAATTRALARSVSGMGEALARLAPDIVMVLGDRYEILGVAQACLLARVPIVHLCGGDITEGAIDDAIRHAVSKLSHLHCVSNAPAAERLRRMGEDPARVINTGSPGLDALRLTPVLERAALFTEIGLEPRERLIVATFHPPTLDEISGARQFAEMAAALDDFGDEVALVLTGSNADPEGRLLTDLAERYAARRANAVFRVSLGQRLYVAAMRHAAAIVGNSSSGLYEAPSFGVATVNIGARQDGRLRARSVIDVAPERNAIAAAIRRAFASDFRDVENPYGDGHAGPRIVAAIKAAGDPRALLRKTFHMQA